jgi:hypothetical protein
MTAKELERFYLGQNTYRIGWDHATKSYPVRNNKTEFVHWDVTQTGAYLWVYETLMNNSYRRYMTS